MAHTHHRLWVCEAKVRTMPPIAAVVSAFLLIAGTTPGLPSAPQAAVPSLAKAHRVRAVCQPLRSTLTSPPALTNLGYQSALCYGSAWISVSVSGERCS
jgi:hypothetical protein